MKSTSIISFLLPAYKAAYFAEALRSIKNQTYTDFTCLVSDDCSPEDLKSIYDREVGNDPRFTYRRNEENMGGKSLVSHWNLLLDMCTTDYFVLASDDDVYDPRYLEEMMRLVVKYPEVDLLRARCRIIDGEGVVQQEDALSEEFESQDVFLYRFWAQRIACIANYMFRTQTLKNKGCFVDLPLAWGSDDATVLVLCEKGAASPMEILFSFRQSGRNISSIEDECIVRKKLEATKQFSEFLCQYCARLESSSLNPLEKYHFLEFKKRMSSVNYAFISFSWVLSFSELCAHYFYLRRRGIVNGTVNSSKFFFEYFMLKFYRH